MIPKEIVLITGASGMIAKKMTNLLLKKGYEVRTLSRPKKTANEFMWNIDEAFIDLDALKNVSHIIHLAGANISNHRWTTKYKKEITDSRVNSTRLLFQKIKEEKIKLKTFISGSAVGYYGTSKADVLFTEESLNGTDFLSEVCKQWELAADSFSTIENLRLVKLRFGVVFDSNKGALHKMLNPIRLGFGAVLGKGKQYIPWIHVDDLCQLILFSLENRQIYGVYNAVAPQHITNQKLTDLLAKKLHKKIWLPNIPAFILQLILGEMANLVLYGNRISSDKIIASGFVFNYPNIDKALDELMGIQRLKK